MRNPPYIRCLTWVFYIRFIYSVKCSTGMHLNPEFPPPSFDAFPWPVQGSWGISVGVDCERHGVGNFIVASTWSSLEPFSPPLDAWPGTGAGCASSPSAARSLGGLGSWGMDGGGKGTSGSSFSKLSMMESSCSSTSWVSGNSNLWLRIASSCGWLSWSPSCGHKFESREVSGRQSWGSMGLELAWNSSAIKLYPIYQFCAHILECLIGNPKPFTAATLQYLTIVAWWLHQLRSIPLSPNLPSHRSPWPQQGLQRLHPPWLSWKERTGYRDCEEEPCLEVLDGKTLLNKQHVWDCICTIHRRSWGGKLR